MSMKKIKTEAVEKSSWWYWFKKSDDGNIATCNNCDWTKERGTARSTSILRCHLKAKHPELYLEKVEADGNTQKVGNLGLKRKKEGTSAMEEESEDNEEEVNEEVQDRLSVGTIDSNPTVENHQQDGGDAAADEMMEEVKLSRDFVSLLSNYTAYSNYNSQQNTIPSTSMSSFPSHVTGASSNFNSLQSTNQQNQTSNKSLKTASNNYIKQQIVPQQIVKLCRMESFSSAHRLHNPKFDLALNKEIYGKCNNPNGHGHNYTWKVVIEGPVNVETGMVYNLTDLKHEMAEVMEEVDHKNLDKDVAYFRDNGIVSTTENLAIFLYNKLAERMRNPELLKKVVVYETDKNSFSYTGHR